MALKARVTRRGGKKLQKLLKEAGKSGVTRVEVGFFSTAKYEDGTPVAAVAAWNEFGTGPHTIRAKPGKVLAFAGSDGNLVFAKSVEHPGIPERPFFRRAIAEIESGLPKILKQGINPETMVVDQRLADLVGAYAQGQVQDSIILLRDPPNSPSTIRAKQSSNPLFDSGFMKASVTWRVS